MSEQDLRNLEENPTGSDGKMRFRHEDLGTPGQGAPGYGAPQPMMQQYGRRGGSQQQPGLEPEDQTDEHGNPLREEAEGRLTDAAKDKAKERLGQGGAEGAKKGAQKGAERGAQAGARAGGAAGAGAAEGAAAGAGAAGAGAGAAGAAAGGAAAGGAAAGAEGAALAAGAATSETGVGAVAGAAIAVGIFVARHRRELMAIGAIVFVGVLIAGVALLNALKPIASTLQAATKYLSPVQQIVDNRSVSILGRFVTGGSAAAVAIDQQQKMASQTPTQNGGRVLAATSDGVVTEGKLKTLFDAMKADQFEQRIKEKFGLELKPNGNAVQIVHRGAVLGEARNATEATNILRNQFIDLQRLLGEELYGFNWAQHMKGARNMKGAYDIPALAIPGAESAYDAGSLVEIVQYQISTIMRSGLDNMRRSVACFTNGEECNELGIPVDGEAVAELQEDERSSMTIAAEKAHAENLENIKPENNYDVNRVDTLAGAKAQEKLDQQAVGLLGWLDIAATTHVMAQKEGAQQLPSILRTKQAGAFWTWHASAIDQLLAGDVSSPAAGLITRGYKFIEDSQAYFFVAYDDVTRGIGLPDSKKINSKIKNAFSFIYQSMTVENPVIQTGMSVAFRLWLVVNNTPAGFLIDLATRTPFGNFADRFLGAVLNKVGVVDFVEQTLGISSSVALPICDPSNKDYNTFNCLASGAHVAANLTCEQFGCGTLTVAQENEIRYASRQDMDARLATMPWHKRLFDARVSNSFINVAAMNSPLPMRSTDNIASMAQGVFSTVWGAPQRVAALSAQPARAANADASLIDGVETLGIPLQKLRSAPLASQASQKDAACPETERGVENMCMADISTIDSLIGRYTYDPAYGG